LGAFGDAITFFIVSMLLLVLSASDRKDNEFGRFANISRPGAMRSAVRGLSGLTGFQPARQPCGPLSGGGAVGEVRYFTYLAP